MILSSSSLQGNKVRNHMDEDLGSVEDFMLNTTTGAIEYAVVSFGGFMGMGDKLFAVPLEAMNLDTKNKAFILNESKKRLERAPGFDKDDWPNMADTLWSDSIRNYYRV